MLNYYYNYVTDLFLIFPALFWFLIIVWVLTTIALIYICIGLFLDATYRPDSLQNPFSIILDRVLPLTAIFTPTLVILYINPEKLSLMEKLGFIILLDIFVLAPIMLFWSRHRIWFQNNDVQVYVSWNHPQLYYNITIAIIYPSVWGFYFSILRYFRLGLKIDFDIPKLFLLLFDNSLVIFIFIIPLLHVLLWFLLLFRQMLLVQKYIWIVFSNLIFSIYLELLRYSSSCKFLEKLYKLHFIFFNIICLNAPVNIDKEYYSYNIIRRALHNLYYYPVIIYIILFIFVFIEIISTKKVFFSYYIFFGMPIIISIFKAFNTFGRMSFIKDTCMINYFTQNIHKIYYKPVFWRYAENPEMFYGHLINLTTENYTLWEKYYLENKFKELKYSYKVRERLMYKINSLQNKHPKNIIIFLLRIKTAYYNTYGIRWNYNPTINK